MHQLLTVGKQSRADTQFKRREGKVKSAYKPILWRYPGFCCMKQLGVFLLPPGWDASPSQESSWLVHSTLERAVQV